MLSPHVSQSCCEAQEGARNSGAAREPAANPTAAASSASSARAGRTTRDTFLRPHTLHGYAIDGCTSPRSRRSRADTARARRDTTMVFYLVGLGLGDERDITVRGL